jgi:hypothetical protein
MIELGVGSGPGELPAVEIQGPKKGAANWFSLIVAMPICALSVSKTV